MKGRKSIDEDKGCIFFSRFFFSSKLGFVPSEREKRVEFYCPGWRARVVNVAVRFPFQSESESLPPPSCIMINLQIIVLACFPSNYFFLSPTLQPIFSSLKERERERSATPLSVTPPSSSTQSILDPFTKSYRCLDPDPAVTPPITALVSDRYLFYY